MILECEFREPSGRNYDTIGLLVNIQNHSRKLCPVLWFVINGEGLSLKVAENSATKVIKGLGKKKWENLKKLGLVSLERKEDEGQFNSNLYVHKHA